MLKTIISCTCILVMLICLPRCGKEQAIINTDTLKPPPAGIGEIAISTSPDIGTTGTEFVFTLSVIHDSSLSSQYQVRCDWDNDGVFDTEWLDSLIVSHLFLQTGKQIASFTIRNQSGHTKSLLDTIYTCEFLDITPMITDGMPGNVDWAPDGSNRIAFDWAIGGCEHQIYVMDYPGGTPERMTFDGDQKCHQYAEWSPDGKKIVYVNNFDSAVDCIHTKTKEITRIINQKRYPFAWSPDGKGILSNTNRSSGTDSLYYYHVANGHDSLILIGPGSFCWSPNGEMIAYTKFLSPNGGIHFYNFKSGSLIKELPIERIQKMDWSLDEKWIILGSNDSNELFVLNYQNEKRYKMMCGQFYQIQYPSWSSEGSLLVFEGRLKNSSRWSIWAVRFPIDLD